MKRSAFALVDRGYKSVLFVLVAGLLGGAVGFLVRPQPALNEKPVGSWTQLPPSPAEFTRFVTDPYQRSAEVQVIASTSRGSLYALDCSGASCAWTQWEALPSPGEPMYDWCGEPSTTQLGPASMPVAPGQIVDIYVRRNCQVDFWIDSHYALLDNGTVWEWESAYYARGNMYRGVIRTVATVLWTACWSIAGGVTGLMAVIRIRKAARR